MGLMIRKPLRSKTSPEDILLKNKTQLQFVQNKEEKFHFILKSSCSPFKTEIYWV